MKFSKCVYHFPSKKKCWSFHLVLWKLKSRFLIKNGVWRLEERTHTPGTQHTADPKRKRHNIAYLTGCDTLSPPKQEAEKIPPCSVAAQPMGDCQDSANEKLLHLELPVFSNGLFVYNSQSQIYKRVYLPFVSLHLAGGLPLDCMSQI